MYRKTSLTYAHSYKILLFDSQNSAFSLRYTHADSTKHSPRIRVPRAIFHSRYTSLLTHSKTNAYYLTLSRKKETFYLVSFICAYNNRVGNDFTPATVTICHLFSRQRSIEITNAVPQFVVSVSRKNKNVSA